LFYQLKSFDETLSDATIATQAGIMHASFTAAQFLTAMLWGRVSDSEWGGRKMVLMIGLLGTCERKIYHVNSTNFADIMLVLSCLGFGFSQTFWQAILFRTMGGALNGNVGVMRTMISELIREKKWVFILSDLAIY
jgi:MFS family permease